MKKPQLLFGALCIAILGSVLGLGYFNAPKPEVSHQFSRLNSKNILIRGETVRLFVVDNDADRQKGLSGSTRLADNEGMLFVFPEKANHSFWMKEMNYPIDIVFLDDGHVVDVYDNVAPETYPELFSPREPANYVIEFNDTGIERFDIKIGDRVPLK